MQQLAKAAMYSSQNPPSNTQIDLCHFSHVYVLGLRSSGLVIDTVLLPSRTVRSSVQMSQEHCDSIVDREKTKTELEPK